MSASPTADLCRVVVVTPRKSAELALPANVALADLVAALLAQVGRDDAEGDWAGAGVVVQRLGGPPLDEDRTPAELGLHDGDTLYLRPRDVPMPALTYDDLIDGVATRLQARAGRWSPVMTRRALLVVALVVLLLGVVALLLDGPAAGRAVAGGAAALVLLGGAGAAARSFDDRAAALVLGAGAVGYAAVGGFLVPLAAAGPGPAQLLAAAVTATAAAGLVGPLVGTARPPLVAFAAVGVCAILAGLLTTVGPLPTVGVAALLATLVLLLSPMIPSVAFWLAGHRLPALPTTVEEIGADPPTASEEVMAARTMLAEDFVTAFHVAVGAVCLAALTWLAPAGGWAPTALTVVVCWLLALRCRVLVHAWQRLAVLLPAAYGAVLLTVRGVRDLSPALRPTLVVTAALLIGAAALAAARLLPGRQLRPHWGRAAELLESLSGLALVPLLLAVLGVFGLVRGLGG
jgi:type VII secretion integral membrane protein EccD